MGFEEERVKKVLKHYKNNLNMAMDYLINTAPENDAILNSNTSNHSSQQSSVYIIEFLIF